MSQHMFVSMCISVVCLSIEFFWLHEINNLQNKIKQKFFADINQVNRTDATKCGEQKNWKAKGAEIKTKWTTGGIWLLSAQIKALCRQRPFHLTLTHSQPELSIKTSKHHIALQMHVEDICASAERSEIISRWKRWLWTSLFFSVFLRNRSGAESGLL